MKIKVLDYARLVYHEELGLDPETGDELDTAGTGFRPRKPGDAGVDLRCTRDITIPAGATEVVPLGVNVDVGFAMVGLLIGRSSSVTRLGCHVHTGAIDSGYRGEPHLIVTAMARGVHITRGERVCQLLVQPVCSPVHWEIVDELNQSDRGQSGLGSTGR